MNPFDALEVDPRLTPKELTDELRVRVERADEETKQKIQTYWRMLTLKEEDRVRWAIFAHPRPKTAAAQSIDDLRNSIPPAVVRHADVNIECELSDYLVGSPPVPIDEPDI